MGTISPDIPTPGGTTANEEPKIPDALNAIVTLVNGNLENVNVSANAAISGSKLADKSVDTAQLADLSIKSDQLARDCITALKIEDDAVNASHLDVNAVFTENIRDDAVTPEKMYVASPAVYNNKHRTNNLAIGSGTSLIATDTLAAGTWYVTASTTVFGAGAFEADLVLLAGLSGTNRKATAGSNQPGTWWIPATLSVIYTLSTSTTFTLAGTKVSGSPIAIGDGNETHISAYRIG